MEAKKLDKVQFEEKHLVEFNKDVEFFTLSVKGDKSIYLQTIRALLQMLTHVNHDAITSTERYCIYNLIEGMLPYEEQIKDNNSSDNEERSGHGTI